MIIESYQQGNISYLWDSILQFFQHTLSEKIHTFQVFQNKNVKDGFCPYFLALKTFFRTGNPVGLLKSTENQFNSGLVKVSVP